MGRDISSAALIVGASLLPLVAFYLMDRLWYHRLLDGSVAAGISAESELKTLGVVVDLGMKISQSSPFTVPLINLKVHSRHKMDWFYGLLALALVILTVTLGVGVKPVNSSSSAVGVILVSAEDKEAGPAVCKSYVQSLLAQASGNTGFSATDPLTSKHAVKIGDQWRWLPICKAPAP